MKRFLKGDLVSNDNKTNTCCFVYDNFKNLNIIDSINFNSNDNSKFAMILYICKSQLSAIVLTQKLIIGFVTLTFIKKI